MTSLTQEVTIREFDHGLDLSGATVIDGFPSVGLVSTIAANFLIDTLGLKQIGVMDHQMFPTLSVVHGAEPLSPVRIYAGKPGDRAPVVVFISEFQPPSPLMRPIGDAILGWAKSHSVGLVISPEGLVLEGDAADDDVIEVYGIGSNPAVNGRLSKAGVDLFQEGIITGVCGVLLNSGKREGQDVMSVLSEAHANFPDARAAAAVIEVLAKVLDLEVDLTPLMQQAQGFEDQIKRLQGKAKAAPGDARAQPSMYG